jgi:hypothetical protein
MSFSKMAPEHSGSQFGVTFWPQFCSEDTATLVWDKVKALSNRHGKTWTHSVQRELQWYGAQPIEEFHPSGKPITGSVKFKQFTKEGAIPMRRTGKHANDPPNTIFCDDKVCDAKCVRRVKLAPTVHFLGEK